VLAVCNLSVCRRINKQYKHNLSCTMHNHRRLYRRIPSIDILPRLAKYLLHIPQSPMSLQTDTVHWYFTEAGLLEFYVDAFQITDRLWKFQSASINASLTMCIYRRTYQWTVKILEGHLKNLVRNSKFTDGLLKIQRQNN
jgi:hypothetical protein